MNIGNSTNETNLIKDSIYNIDTTVVIIEIALSILAFFLNLALIFAISLCLAKKKNFFKYIIFF
jgi:hypothetical protein